MSRHSYGEVGHTSGDLRDISTFFVLLLVFFIPGSLSLSYLYLFISSRFSE